MHPLLTAYLNAKRATGLAQEECVRDAGPRLILLKDMNAESRFWLELYIEIRQHILLPA